jgi:hypothetical protein
MDNVFWCQSKKRIMLSYGMKNNGITKFQEHIHKVLNSGCVKNFAVSIFTAVVTGYGCRGLN